MPAIDVLVGFLKASYGLPSVIKARNVPKLQVFHLWLRYPATTAINFSDIDQWLSAVRDRVNLFLHVLKIFSGSDGVILVIDSTCQLIDKFTKIRA
jgi:hypothetical protein